MKHCGTAAAVIPFRLRRMRKNFKKSARPWCVEATRRRFVSFEPQIKDGSRHFKLRHCDVAVFRLISTSQHIVTGLDGNLDDIQTARVCAQFWLFPGSHLFLAELFTLSLIMWQKLTVAWLGTEVWKRANIEKNNGWRMKLNVQNTAMLQLWFFVKDKRAAGSVWSGVESETRSGGIVSWFGFSETHFQKQLLALMFKTMHTILTNTSWVGFLYSFTSFTSFLLRYFDFAHF